MSCADQPMTQAGVWTLRIVQAEDIDGMWQASRIEGTMRSRFEPSAAASAAGCRPGRLDFRFEGELA